MTTPTTRTALDELAEYLLWHHPNYTVADVKPSEVPGYLECTKPCPGAARGHWWCSQHEHYHTISIAGKPDFVHGNYGPGMYAFWRAVCAELRARHQ